MEKEKAKKKGRRLFSGIGKSVRDSYESSRLTKTSGVALLCRLSLIALGFLFGGCHLVFGSYPLGLALVAVLPSGVWLALIGVVLGCLALGKAGVIYVLVCILSVFLRVVISGSEGKRGTERGSGQAFGESLLLRMSSAVIGGFVAAVYELLLEGISFATVMFGLSMILLPAVLTFALSGFFDSRVSAQHILFGGKNVFSVKTEDKKEWLELAFFRISALLVILLISVSLKKYNIFGVDLSLVFAALVTLFVAKRFGALYAMVCGFVGSVATSALYSVAFALLGVGAGVLFTFGTAFALLGGGVLLSLWGAYSGGAVGFLSVFPEYAVAGVCMLPLLRYFEREKKPEQRQNSERAALDMVGTMALAYRNRQSLCTESLERAIGALGAMMKRFGSEGVKGSREQLELIGRLMSEARAEIEQSRGMDEELTARLEVTLDGFGFPVGVIRAFGGRRKYFICAAEDKDGTKITDKALVGSIESASGLKLGEPEYFRRGDMVVMECEAAKSLKVSFAHSCAAGESGEVSGDSVRVFESEDMHFCAVLSDGMGSGSVAKRTSEFVCEFLSVMLGTGASETTVLHMLNTIIRDSVEECSATVDLFKLDLINREAFFIKSGAVASYIKRGSSVFRIRSETVPMGVLKAVDAERISAKIIPGDTVILFSDGICQSAEDAPWLIELLNRPIAGSLQSFADKILCAATKNNVRRDDMSVILLQIDEAA